MPSIDPFRVSVPCSTSNLGPGFDCLGLALEREISVSVRPRSDAVADRSALRLATAAGTLAEPGALTGEERIVRAATAFARNAGKPLPAADLHAISNIPVARGLGSSGSATVAGLAIAARLLGLEPSMDLLFRLGCELEGHPDNIGPALMGGCVIAMPAPDGNVSWFQTRVHPDLQIVVAVPPTRVETGAARSVLPKTVTFETARDQARRLAQLIHGIETGSKKYIQTGIIDHLHTPYRAPLIPGCDRVMRAAVDAGAFAAAISGSGSSIIAISLRGAAPVEPILDAMRAAFADAGENADCFVSQVPRVGFTISGDRSSGGK